MSYETEKFVRELTPEQWLDASRFATDHDTLAVNIARQEENYQRGLRTGQNATEVGINYNGAWFASNRDGSFLTSYESIGYHANTRFFWQGVIDSGVRIIVKQLKERVGIKTIVIRECDLDLAAV